MRSPLENRALANVVPPGRAQKTSTVGDIIKSKSGGGALLGQITSRDASAQMSGRVGFTPLARLQRLDADERARLGSRLLDVGRDILRTYEANGQQTHEYIWRPPIAELSREFDLSFPYHYPGSWEGHTYSSAGGIWGDVSRDIGERFKVLGCQTAAMMNDGNVLTLRFLYYQAIYELMVYCGVDKQR